MKPSERSALIKLASSMPKGSKERRTLLFAAELLAEEYFYFNPMMIVSKRWGARSVNYAGVSVRKNGYFGKDKPGWCQIEVRSPREPEQNSLSFRLEDNITDPKAYLEEVKRVLNSGKLPPGVLLHNGATWKPITIRYRGGKIVVTF